MEYHGMYKESDANRHRGDVQYCFATQHKTEFFSDA